MLGACCMWTDSCGRLGKRAYMTWTVVDSHSPAKGVIARSKSAILNCRKERPLQ